MTDYLLLETGDYLLQETGDKIILESFTSPLSPQAYTIEVRNSDGDLVAILENAHAISYGQVINAPYSLSFDLPADDSKASNILLANEYWLRDNRTGTVVRKFRLQKKTDTRV